MNQEAQTRGLVLVACAGVFWSLQGIMIRLVSESTPGQVVFWRGISQCLAMLVIILIASRGRVLATVRDAGVLGIIGGLCSMLAGLSFVLGAILTETARRVRSHRRG